MRNVGRSKGAASVVMAGVDSNGMGLVREVLAAEAVLPSSSVAFGDAMGVVKRSRPDVIIIGFSQAKDAALALAQTLHKESPNCTLIALAQESDADAILAAMRVGYKEYVVLPKDANRLRQAVHEAAFSPSDDGEKGLVISITGAKGGVGTTLLSTHLSAELAGIHRVICIDLNFNTGDVASVFDVNPKDAITDVLPRADGMDEQLIAGSVAVHRSKVHVLAQPNELERIEEVRGDDVYSIILAAAKGYQYVILDCGNHWDEATSLALSVSDVVVLVTTPDVNSVRDAHRRLKLFNSVGIEKDQLRLVVNRYDKNAFVKKPDISQNLQLPIAATIDNDSKTVDEALNKGKLVRSINRKAEVAKDISKLVAIITDTGSAEEEEEDESSKGFFSGFFGKG